MINYTKINDSLLQNTKLKLTSRVIYARLVYRMNLSIHNDKTYFDQKGRFYYVIYQIKDLMHDCGLGRHAVINALDQLVHVGLVIKHKAKHFTRVKHLELPKFHFVKSVSTKTKTVKITKTTKTNKKTNKFNSKSDRRLKRSADRWTNTDIPKIDPKLDHQNAVKAVKFRRIPKPVISMIESLFNGKTLTNCIHVILQAKKSVYKDHYKSKKYAKVLIPALDFDANNYYTFDNSKKFVSYLNHGLRKAWHNAKQGKLWNYFMKVCKTYFNYALNYFYQNSAVNVKQMDGPEIPIFRI